MTQAEELLESLPDAVITSDTEYDDTEYFIINADTRTINKPAGFTCFGVESDESADLVHFKSLNQVSDITKLSDLNLYINYKNANGEMDKYVVEDAAVVGDYIYFSWKLSRKVLKYKGIMSFIVCGMRTNDEAIIDVEWNTTLCSGPILEGLEVDNPEIEESTYDLIDQLVSIVRSNMQYVNDRTEAAVTAINDAKTAALSDITALKDESTAAIDIAKQEALDYIGTGIDETLSKNGVAADAKVTGDELKKKGSAIICNASGDSIILNDSYEAPFEYMKIYGKTNQVHTTGKNLFCFSSENSLTDSGVTVTVDSGTSVIKVSGKATTNFGTGFPVASLPAGTYTLSISGLLGAKDYVFLRKADSSAFITSNLWNGQSVTFTITETSGLVLGVVFQSSSNYAYSDATVYLQIESGETATDYEPYSNGVASPSPEYPQPMETIGSHGAIKFEVNTKNLFWFKEGFNTTSVGITASADAGGSVIKVNGKATDNFYIGATISTLPAGTYTLSVSSALGNADYMFLKDKDSDVYFVPDIKKGQSATFTLTKNTNLRTGLIILSSSDYTYSNETVYLQIEKGQTATNYEPSKNQILEIGDEYTFAGIPVTSNGNYTDENGQQWVCDEIDFEKGVYVQRINSYTITGTENWARSATQSSTDGHVRYDVLVPYQSAKSSDALCNYYPYRGTNMPTGIGAWVYSSGANYLNLRVVTSHTTLDEFKAFLVEKYSSDTPVVIQYILAKPIETPLSDEEIALYNACYTNKTTTTIINDANAYMDLSYIADTGVYISNNYVPKTDYDALVARVTALEQGL